MKFGFYSIHAMLKPVHLNILWSNFEHTNDKNAKEWLSKDTRTDV